MRVAVLSDIHANVQALEEVMKDVVAQKCDHVFCLGDLALAGPSPKEVVEYVMMQDSWTVIQGNTDKMIAQYGPDVIAFLEEQYPVMANAIADDVSILSDKHRAYLNNLPPMPQMEVEGVSILLVHGSPRANNEDILPEMPLDKIEEMIFGTTENLILCGHTHIPCGYQTRTRQTVVNVGSVGRPMTKEPKACYAILDLNNGAFEIRHRFVEYNNVKAAKIMSERGFVGADRLADLLLTPGERHV